MLLTYVDESYTKDRYYIAGLAVHHDKVRSLENAIRKVMVDAAAAISDLDETTELHGHPMYQGKEAWKAVNPRQRIAVYGSVLQAVADHEVGIFLCGLDIPAQHKRYIYPDPPHGVVLQHLLERVNTHAAATDQAVLVIADEIDEHDRHRTSLGEFRRVGTPGYLSSQLPRIVDTIHFAPSHHSRLLQAADLVAFLHRRRETIKETDARAAKANDSLWARIEPHIRHQRCWSP